jgi:hypothetical protein
MSQNEETKKVLDEIATQASAVRSAFGPRPDKPTSAMPPAPPPRAPRGVDAGELDRAIRGARSIGRPRVASDDDQPRTSCAGCEDGIEQGADRYCTECKTGEPYTGPVGASRGTCAGCGRSPIQGPAWCSKCYEAEDAPAEDEEARAARHQRTARAVEREHGPIAARAYREGVGLQKPSVAPPAPAKVTPPKVQQATAPTAPIAPSELKADKHGIKWPGRTGVPDAAESRAIVAEAACVSCKQPKGKPCRDGTAIIAHGACRFRWTAFDAPALPPPAVDPNEAYYASVTVG